MDTQRRRKQITEKIDQLRSTKDRSSACVYLAENMDKDLFCAILDNFDTSPTSPEVDVDFVSGYQSSAAALQALTELATIMASIDAATSPPGRSTPSSRIPAFVDMCLEMVLERWSEILKWITFYTRPGLAILPTWGRMTNACVKVIETAIKDADDNPYKSEIVAFPSTIDCIIRLLCLRNPTTGRPSPLREQGIVCSICGLFSASALSDIGNASVALRLASLDPSTLAELTKCISERIQDAVPNTINATTVGVAATELIQLMSPLSTFPRNQPAQLSPHRIILSEAAHAVAQVVNGAIQTRPQDPAVWSSITLCLEYLTAKFKHPSRKEDRIIEDVLENGLIPTILRSLPYVHPSASRGLEGLAQKVLFWLVDSRMLLAAKKGGLDEELFRRLEKSTARSPRVKSIHDAYLLALGLCALTFEEKTEVPVRLCCNMKHTDPIQRPENVQKLKVCSRCHSAVYCSDVCQREDWIAFHSNECFQALDQRRELREAGFTDRYRRDKTAFLAQVASRSLGDRTHPSIYSKGIRDADLPIHFFDFTGVTLQITSRFVSFVNQTLADVFSTYTVAPFSQARIRQCARDMMHRPNLVLVAGSFIDRHIVTIICIQMQYSPYSAQGERYKVVKTVSSAIFRSSLPEPPPLTEEDTRLLADMGLGL